MSDVVPPAEVEEVVMGSDLVSEDDETSEESIEVEAC